MHISVPKKWAALVGAVLVAVLALFLWRSQDHAETRAPSREAAAPASEPKPLRLTGDEARRAGIQVQRLEPATPAETVELFGTVEVNQDRLVRVVPPVSGRLTKIDVSLGDAVRPGDRLAVIESSEGGEARAAYTQAQSELALSETNLRRISGLASAGSLARKEEVKARTDYEKARAALNAAASKLNAYGLQLGGSGTGALTLVAPLGGTVTEKAAVVGEQAQAHQALFSIGDLSSLWIQANLFERDLGRVSVRSAATVSVAAYPRKTFEGKLTYISSVLDRETRTAKARIEVANPAGELKPGMFATVSVATEGGEPALLVPETALVLVQGQMTAFVAEGAGFEPRPVEAGGQRGGKIIVSSGLEAGDEVVVAGAYALKARLLKSQIGEAD